jgi:hypothetical protein
MLQGNPSMDTIKTRPYKFAQALALSCLCVSPLALAQSSIDNPNGYWEVSAEDGTISKLSASPSATGAMAVTAYVERPGSKSSAHGYRPGDVFFASTFDARQQVVETQRNLKPSASPESSIRNLSCKVFLGTRVRGSLSPFKDKSGQPVPGVFRYKLMTPTEQICEAFTHETGQCRIKKCFEYFSESDFAHITHDTIWTRDRTFAESYAKNITYKGKSYAVLQEDMHRDHREYEQQNAAKAVAIAGAIFGAAAESYQQARKERQMQQFARAQKQRSEFEIVRNQAIADLEVPDAEVCERYAEKDRYKNFDDVRISGVGIGMDAHTAHDAMLCNGFTVNPDLVARAGGLHRFLGGRLVVYYRDDPIHGRMTAELETRQNQSAPSGTAYNVISVRVRYPIDGPLSESEVNALKKTVKSRYKMGGRMENAAGIFYRNRRSGLSMTFAIEQYGNRPGTYALSLCCGQ